MRLLALAHDLPPSLSPQSIQVGRLLYHLPRDWKTYVATSSYATPYPCEAYTDWPKRVEDWLSVDSIHKDRTLGIRMRLLPFLYRIPEPSRWDMLALKRAILRRWGSLSFDRLITFGYPFSSHLLGMKLKTHFRCRWIAHFSDPWYGNPSMNFGPVSRPLNRSWEQKVVAAADQVIFVSEETLEFYAQAYPAQVSKMRLLEHSFDPALYPKPISETAGGRPLLIRFLGNLYAGRSFDELFKALALLVRRQGVSASDLQVELVLSYRRPLHLSIEKYGLGALVKVRPPVGYLESLGLMRSADLLINIDTPLPPSFHKNLFFASKLVDYMGSGKPILAVAGEGASRRIVKKYGGWAAAPDDVEGLAQTLLNLLGQWRAGELQRFRPAASADHDYRAETQSQRFSELLK